MNGNYTYIIASIPVLSPDYKPSSGSCDDAIAWIRSQLSEKDSAKLDLLLKGFTPSELTREFYMTVLNDRNVFLRRFFASDLVLRNEKTAYLNKAFSRPSGTDVMVLDEDGTGINGVGIDEEGIDRTAIGDIFRTEGLLERERAVDDFMWREADRITLFEYFSLDKVLAIVAKLCIIRRWLILDEEKGRQLIKTLIEDIRGTYGKIEFK